ncbi:MAG TPA: hypothetical protein VI546_02290 [candidate division Zixibacteria bacterium]|nr:hypothetical protein [candidate division Zixibacteria bacterium]
MFPLDVPIIIQDGIVVALFASALGVLLYKKLRRKSKACPACEGGCVRGSNLPSTHAG